MGRRACFCERTGAVNCQSDARSEFLAISRAVHPRDKKNAKFLSRILMELDPELARIRLDGRPAPINYAQPTLGSRMALARTTGTKVTCKLKQRIHGTHRPPEGGEALAALVSSTPARSAAPTGCG